VNFYYSLVLEILLNFIIMELLFYVLCRMNYVKMVDKQVCSDLHSTLFDQRGVMSSKSECVCCIDLNNKLKCAFD
jgi:hypothetical protein